MLDIEIPAIQGKVSQQQNYLTWVPKPPLNRWINCFWQLTVPPGGQYYRSMPDNCVDCIFNLSNSDDAHIVSPFLESMVFKLTGPVVYFGIRFRILGHGGIVTEPVGEWGQSQSTVKVQDILKPSTTYRLIDGIHAPQNFEQRCRMLSEVLLSSIKMPTLDTRVLKFIRYCHLNPYSNTNLSDKQCSEFGLSARQLRRLSQLYLGLSPKEFSRVIRFQYLLKAINQSSGAHPWAEFFYDQAHFIREFKSLSGVTPTDFLKMSVLYNSEQS